MKRMEPIIDADRRLSFPMSGAARSSPPVVEHIESGFVPSSAAREQKPAENEQEDFPGAVEVDFADRSDRRMTAQDSHLQATLFAPALHGLAEFHVLAREQCLIEPAKFSKGVG